MGAQFGDRAEPDGPVRKLGLDRSIRIQRIGHAVDNARFQDCRGGRRLRGRGFGLVSFYRRSLLGLRWSFVQPRLRFGVDTPARPRIGGPERTEALALGRRTFRL